jgi:DNA-binding NarL/FixJ family response regulator
MIHVILAEDHHLVRQGIRSLLEDAPDITVVAEAENGHEAVHLVRELKPDVLITDINMPRLNGIQAAEQIRELGLVTRVVILSMHSDPTLIRQALRCGVKGYLLKHSLTDELLLGVRAAARGETFLCPGIADLVIADFLTTLTQPESANGYDRLSPREREILKLVAEGYTNKAIAEAIQVSIKTVEKHRSNLMAKLNVQDLAGLIRMALKHGLIFLDE